MLDTSRTYKGLSVKMKLGPFEAFDLILCLLVTALLNMFLRDYPFAPFFILGLSGLLLIGLYWGKRGKPEGYWGHLIYYLLSPGHYSAAQRPQNQENMRGSIVNL